VRYSNRPIYQRRRRIALLIFVLFILVMLYVLGLIVGGTGGEQTEQQVGAPVVGPTIEATDEQTVAEETTS